MAEVIEHLVQHNPELLDMAVRCANDLPASETAMIGFSMFYRLLAQSAPIVDAALLSPLPRVGGETRGLLMAEIDQKGLRGFHKGGVGGA
jgi:hypothetical protein